MRLILALSVFLLFICTLAPQYLTAQTVQSLQNPSFENGTSFWTNLTDQDIDTQNVYSGQASLHLSEAKDITQEISVAVGRTYTLSGWFYWDTFAGSGWGYDRVSVTDQNKNVLIEESNLHSSYSQASWNSFTVEFTPTTETITVQMGVFGPRSQVSIYFDELTLFQNVGNSTPIASFSTSPTQAQAPALIQFNSGSSDSDGQIVSHLWDFGDGSQSDLSSPTHTYSSPGLYEVTLTVTDNTGSQASKSQFMTVTEPSKPEVPPQCHADVDSNGLVDRADLASVINFVGSTCIVTGPACELDINRNGVVDLGDVAATLYFWNQTCSQ